MKLVLKTIIGFIKITSYVTEFVLDAEQTTIFTTDPYNDLFIVKDVLKVLEPEIKDVLTAFKIKIKLDGEIPIKSLE